jgi:DNA-binding HxlR family transcriptional regulator
MAMLERQYESQVCAVARTLEAVGERWTLLIVRDAFRGMHRFAEFHRSLGVARNVLTARLHLLCEYGIFERRSYGDRGRRAEYWLTDRGRDLFPVIVSLMQWGDRYLAQNGPPRIVQHRGCGGTARATAVCDTCDQTLRPQDVRDLPGPGWVESASVRLVAKAAPSEAR